MCSGSGAPDGEEGDGDEPEAVEQRVQVRLVVRLARAHHPGEHEPDGRDEEEERRARRRRHVRLEHERRVQRDAVERADRPDARVGHEPRVQHQRAAHQVAAQEHEHAEQLVGRHQLAHRLLLRAEERRLLPHAQLEQRRRVHGAQEQLARHLQHTLPAESDPPVVERTVGEHYLQRTESHRVASRHVHSNRCGSAGRRAANLQFEHVKVDETRLEHQRRHAHQPLEQRQHCVHLQHTRHLQ